MNATTVPIQASTVRRVAEAIGRVMFEAESGRVSLDAVSFLVAARAQLEREALAGAVLVSVANAQPAQVGAEVDIQC